MREAEPSATALRVAARRAAHQLFDDPKVLDDPLALRILGAEAGARLRGSRLQERAPIARTMRAFMVARARFAEDELAQARRREADVGESARETRLAPFFRGSGAGVMSARQAALSSRATRPPAMKLC